MAPPRDLRVDDDDDDDDGRALRRREDEGAAMPLATRPLFSRLTLLWWEEEDDGGPAQRGIMDLRDRGTRRRAAAPLPAPLPLPTLPLLLPTLLADDGLADGGRGGGLACALARVCRRGLTGMVPFVYKRMVGNIWIGEHSPTSCLLAPFWFLHSCCSYTHTTT